ncbi:MAG: DUF3189 family protein [Caldicoprobacterales bacterium]|jgi:hypothetical protein|nr:DUF3189 family protein [Clostridiales bacterium]
MKLFYHCFGGAHTSITCAAIHLGYLPMDRVPGSQEFNSVPYYDKMEDKNCGTPIYLGRDELGIDIYAIGLKNACHIMIPAIKSYLNTNDIQSKDLLFVESLVKLHPITGIGGFLSRKLHLVSIGRPLTVWGIRRRYGVFVEIVSRVKESLSGDIGIS